jgi:hypothetical protein
VVITSPQNGQDLLDASLIVAVQDYDVAVTLSRGVCERRLVRASEPVVLGVSHHSRSYRSRRRESGCGHARGSIPTAIVHDQDLVEGAPWNGFELPEHSSDLTLAVVARDEDEDPVAHGMPERAFQTCAPMSRSASRSDSAGERRLAGEDCC